MYARMGNDRCVEALLGSAGSDDASKSGDGAAGRAWRPAEIADGKGQTALMHAAMNGHVSCMELLLARRARRP